MPATPMPPPTRLPPPVNQRPYVSNASEGHEIHTRSPDGEVHQTWRQVGWHGQTGALYGLNEKPSNHEAGSFSPLYVMIDADRED